MRLLTIGILLVLLSALISAAEAQNFSSLPGNTWVQMSPLATQRWIARTNTNNMSNVTTVISLESYSNPSGRSYSGIEYGDGLLFYWGGGHGSYSGNDVELYDIENNVWIQQYKPEVCASDMPNFDQCKKLYGGGGSGTITPTGKPYVEHTWTYNSYDPVTRKFYAAYSNGYWAFDPATKQWSQIINETNILWKGGAESNLFDYDPDIDAFPLIMTSYNPGNYRITRSGQVTNLSGSPAIRQDFLYSTYIPDKKIHIVHAQSNNRWFKYDAVNNIWSNITVPTGINITDFDYDSANRKIIGIKDVIGNFEVWSYDIDSDQWIQLPSPAVMPPGSMTSPTSTSTSPSFRYDKINNVFWFMSGNGGNCGAGSGCVNMMTTWAYRYKNNLSATNDTAPPFRFNGAPSGTLAAGTTQTTISMSTNEAATCRYSTSSGIAYPSMTNIFATTGGTSHSTTVTGLSNGNSYNYFVKCTDQNGNANANDYSITFSVAASNITAPIISGVTASGIAASSATIAWTTNELSDSLVEYGLTASYGSSTILDSSMSAIHSQQITGLAASSTYHYRVKSKDATGNLNISGDYTFTTQAAVSSYMAQIEYQQALDKYMEGKGIAMAGETVVMGIPLKDSFSITGAGQLGLSGSSSYQFWVPNNSPRYPSGNLRWIFAAFSASVAANGKGNDVYLITGSGSSGDASLASDQGSSISIKTGPANFSIRKQNFNFINSAVVNGQAIISQGHTGGIVASDGSATYSSINDAGSTAAITVNGPEYAVVTAKGVLKDTMGNGYFQYQVDFYFYRNKPWFRSQVHIFNGQQSPNTQRMVRYVDVVLPLNQLNSNLFADFSKGESSTGEFQLNAGENAFIYHGYSKRNQGLQDGITIPGETGDFGAAWAGMAPPVDRSVQSGFFIFRGSTELTTTADHDSYSDWSRGWARLGDSTGKGVAVAYRGFHAFFPSAIEINSADKALRIAILSNRTTVGPLVWDYMTAETREFVFEFQTAPSNGEKAWQMANYPMIGRSLDLQAYAETLDVGFVPNLATADQVKNLTETSIPEAENATLPSWVGGSRFSIGNDDQRIWRVNLNNEGGPMNNMDYILKFALPYLQQGTAGHYLSTDFMAQFVSDQAIASSISWNYTDNAFRNKITIGTPFNGGNSKFVGTASPYEHMWVYGLPLAYYLTTNEYYADMLKEQGEMIKSRLVGKYAGGWGPCTDGSDRDSRQSAHIMANAALVYYFAGQDETEFKQSVDSLMNSRKLSDASAISESRMDDGWWPARGYYWYGSPTGTNQHLARPLMHDNLVTMSMFYAHQALNRGQEKARQEKLRGGLLSKAYFYLDEQLWYAKNASNGPDRYGKVISFYYLERPQDPRCAGTPDGMPVPGVPNLTGCGNLGVWQAGHLMALGYLLSGDSEFIAQGRINMIAVPKYQASGAINPNFYTLWDPQYAWFTYIVKNMNYASGSLSIEVQPFADGTYRLTWTPPAGAKNSWIKYADKPIVPTLRFDQSSRSYQFDPAAFAVFGLGGMAGEAQTLQQVNLSAGQYTTQQIGTGKQWRAMWLGFNPDNFISDGLNAPPTNYYSPRIKTLLDGIVGKSTNGKLQVYSGTSMVKEINFTTNSTGDYMAVIGNVPDIVNMKVIVNGFLKRVINNVNLSSASTIAFAPLLAGDINGDNVVNSLDFSNMNTKWYQSDAIADLNKDGIVNALDFSLLNKNWQRAGDV